MTETQANPPETETAEPDPVAQAIAQVRDEFEAKFAGLSSKYNAELAGLRKAIKAPVGEMPAAPKPADPSPGLSAEDTFAIARRISRAETKVGEAHRTRIEDMCAGKSLSQQADLWEIASMFQGESPPQETQARDAQKPGRDARPQPSARGQGPAVRSADAFPSTRAEWMAIVRDPDKSRLNKFRPLIVSGDFDPEKLR